MQIRHFLQGGLEEGIGRQEAHHELRGVQVRAPVPLGRQLVDVGSHVAGEPGHLGVVLLGILALGGVEEGRQWSLGVDVDAPITRESHRHVRTLRSALRGGRLLSLEIAVFQHSGHLSGTLQLHLTPGTAYLRFA